MEGKTASPTTPTWQATAIQEYTATAFYGMDNDDDGANNEYATSQNISYPVTAASNMAVTALHYAAKYRSNSTAQTMDPQIRDYTGIDGTSGWVNTPGTDSNASTTYSWADSWVLSKYQTSPYNTVDTVSDLVNMRMRTSAGNATNPGARDWDFGMMSIRWVEEPARRTLSHVFTPVGGTLVAGTPTTINATNTGSWRGTLGQDGNTWRATRANPGGLDMNVNIDGVDLYGSNKLIFTIRDRNYTTATAYNHQICDWVSSENVDYPADANCTGGGWRILNPRKANYTYTALTITAYEVYNGYFSSRTASPGAITDTPLSNFIDSANKRVLFRSFSAATNAADYAFDYLRLEVAIDSVYEPAAFTNTAGGVTTNFISDLVGSTTGVNASDNNKFIVPMATASQAIDVEFLFKQTRAYEGMNTALVSPEICVSDAALTFGVYLYNYISSSWTQVGSSITGSVCGTDTEYAFAFNNTTVSGFVLSDHRNNGEMRLRFLTNAPATAYDIQFDRIYMMLGSVNADTTKCEISWGTGTATDCTNTRDVMEGKTASPTTSTWQATAVVEYPASFYGLDNDDDGTSAEYAASQNLSFPITVYDSMAVTGLHYAVKYRSNSTAQTMELGIRDYAGIAGTSGWNLLTTTRNNATAYSWFDTWVLAEFSSSVDDAVDTLNNLMNLRARTRAGTTTNPGARDWDFAMMSVRWLEFNEPPVVSTVRLNNQNNIVLVENTAVPISATADITDNNGCATLFDVIAKIYRSGVANAENCTVNENNCYSVTCAADVGSCTGAGDSSATYTCTAKIQYHADPTDSGTPWSSEYWRAWVKATDAGYLSHNAFSPADVPEILSLLAITVSPATINYGSINPGGVVDPANVLMSVINTGNVSVDTPLYGTNMTSGGNSIEVGRQRYNTAVASYSLGTPLTVDPGVMLDLNIPKTTVFDAPEYKALYWGVQVPTPQQTGIYTSVVSFLGSINALPWP
jgi:hypothetical protein